MKPNSGVTYPRATQHSSPPPHAPLPCLFRHTSHHITITNAKDEMEHQLGIMQSIFSSIPPIPHQASNLTSHITMQSILKNQQQKRHPPFICTHLLLVFMQDATPLPSHFSPDSTRLDVDSTTSRQNHMLNPNSREHGSNAHHHP